MCCCLGHTRLLNPAPPASSSAIRPAAIEVSRTTTLFFMERHPLSRWSDRPASASDGTTNPLRSGGERSGRAPAVSPQLDCQDAFESPLPPGEAERRAGTLHSTAVAGGTVLLIGASGYAV